MGLRCSLLGHDFGESEINREREERGDEVVITIREVETCERCGSERVHSENTEVRPVEPIGDVEEESDAGAPTAGAGGTEASATDGSEAASSSAGESPSPAADVGGADGPGPADAGAFDAADTEDPATDPETDDGVILDDEEGTEAPADRTSGEWPDAEDTRVEEREGTASATPEAEADPEPATETNGAPAAEPDAEGEDAEIIGASADDAAGGPADGGDADDGADGDERSADARTVQAGDWPEQDGVDEGFDAEPGGEKTDVEFSGLAPEGEAASAETTPSESPSLSADSETEFVCQECGFSEAAARSSLRAGDICPDCRKGYLREK